MNGDDGFLTQQNRAHYLQAMGLGPMWVQAQHTQAAAPSGVVCKLCQARTQSLWGQDLTKATLVLVGHPSDAQTSHQDESYAGCESVLLNAMLAAIGLSRHSQVPGQTAGQASDRAVHLIYVHQSGTLCNHSPQAGELAVCVPFLREQFALAAPKAVLLLGGFVAQALFQTKVSVNELRGQVHGMELFGHRPIAVVSHHPAHLLRNPGEKAQAWDDLLLFSKVLMPER